MLREGRGRSCADGASRPIVISASRFWVAPYIDVVFGSESTVSQRANRVKRDGIVKCPVRRKTGPHSAATSPKVNARPTAESFCDSRLTAGVATAPPRLLARSCRLAEVSIFREKLTFRVNNAAQCRMA